MVEALVGMSLSNGVDKGGLVVVALQVVITWTWRLLTDWTEFQVPI